MLWFDGYKMSWSWIDDILEKSYLVYFLKAGYISVFLSVFALCFGESNEVFYIAIRYLLRTKSLRCFQPIEKPLLHIK